jgi:hypothetical protein
MYHESQHHEIRTVGEVLVPCTGSNCFICDSVSISPSIKELKKALRGPKKSRDPKDVTGYLSRKRK